MRDITNVARDAAANGATAANLVDNAANVANEAALNTLVNSNRVFINSLPAITDLDC